VAKKTNFNVNGHNYFKVSASVGYGADGSRIRKVFYGSSKKEAIQKRDEYLNMVDNGVALKYVNATFLTAFDEWFNNVVRPSVSLSTFSRHETEYNKRIKNSKRATMKLIDIKSANIQAFYNDVLNVYTPSTVKTTHKLLSSFFIYCIKADIIIKNPLNAVVLPKITRMEKVNKALSDNDVKILLDVAKSNIKYFPFVFALFTGLRAGEMLALKNSDIDLKADTVQVDKSIKFLTVEGEYVPIISSTKTASGIRTVPILSDIRDLLLLHLTYEQEKHKRLEIDYGDSSVLFSSDTCTYRETANMLTAFKRLCKRVGIEPYTLHSLRHTFCTILAKQGVPLKTASVLMGHSDISITANIYTSIDELELRKGVEKLGAYFGSFSIIIPLLSHKFSVNCDFRIFIEHRNAINAGFCGCLSNMILVGSRFLLRRFKSFQLSFIGPREQHVCGVFICVRIQPSVEFLPISLYCPNRGFALQFLCNNYLETKERLNHAGIFHWCAD